MNDPNEATALRAQLDDAKKALRDARVYVRAFAAQVVCEQGDIEGAMQTIAAIDAVLGAKS